MGEPHFNILSETNVPAEPDILLFSPLDASVLVTGTYHLEKNGRRIGSLLLHTVDPSTFSCKLVQKVDCVGAVLDAKWHTLQPDKLLVALSTGSIALYTLDLGGKSPQLHHIETYEQFLNSTLVLSIAVEEKSATVLATLSTGEVSILDVDAQRATSRQTWKAHDLEVWCSAWKTPNEVLTGGDDALLRLWDLRDQDPNCTIQSRCHGAGVTSIHPVSDTLVLTGSYDNTLRLFDYRNLRRPLSSVDLDGGVWRILPRPQTSSSFLTCCMQSGARTISLKESLSVERSSTFEPQENNRLIYGASWQTNSIAAISSFYEKKLYICTIP